MSYPPNNLTQPYIANEIGNYFDKNNNETARLFAHAALGAASAYISGNDAASGALGAASGEAIAILVQKELYGDKSSSQLTQQEKETIRAVATLASGLVGAASGGSFEDSAASAAAGYNAAVNNTMGNDPIMKIAFGDPKEMENTSLSVAGGLAWASAGFKTLIKYFIPNKVLAEKISKYTTKPIDAAITVTTINAYLLHLEADGKLDEGKIISDLITYPTNVSKEHPLLEQAVDNFLGWAFEQSSGDNK
ncbi:MAG: VENN motif pre-toxin domain-containing protein [Sulfurovaceae bacterium]|jgi:hypothetical protein|nr:VENN motif pre-toxin domain-containing protein [Sulfurovaceae bacterium]